MKKQILSLLLAAVMIGSAAVTANAAVVELAPDTTETTEQATEPATEPETALITEPATVAESAPMTEPVTEAPVIRRTQPALAPTSASMPVITRVAPCAKGLKITWSPFDDAAKYFVFMRRADTGKWTRIGTSTATSFEHGNLTNNTDYTYTVRAADRNNQFVSDYDRRGTTFRYLETPRMTGIENLRDAQKLTWEPVDGAESYAVYLKIPAGWTKLGTSDSSSFINTRVTPGKACTYTVRCLDPEDHISLSYYDPKGLSDIYVAAPKIVSCSPVNGGVSVNWTAEPGADRYDVFVRVDGRWKRLGVTEKTSYSHLGLTDGVYTYTIRCMNSSNRFVSGYDTVGFAFRYITPPGVTDVSAENVVTWDSVSDVAGYRVYRKEFGGSWKQIAAVETNTFNDSRSPDDVPYTYTVRCLDADGRVISYYRNNNLYYIAGAPANGSFTVGGKAYAFTDGKLMQGYITVDGKMYYYNASGILQKNGLVGNSKDGWRYADKNGVINLNYTGLATNSAGTWYLKKGTLDRTLRTAVTVNGVDYNILNGRAYKVSTTKDKTLFRAFKLIEKATKPTMSRSQKLRACFYYLIDITNEKNPRIPHNHDKGWPELYANDIFLNKTGNCFSYASSFAYCAKALGYTDIYVCNNGFHGWAEIGGLVFDPQQTKYITAPLYGLKYNSSLITYYLASIDKSVWWMYVAV